MTKLIRILVLVLAVVAISAPDVAAQASDLAAQKLGRSYWHVFAAYAIGWILIFGWVVSIARRLATVESVVKGG